MTIALIVLHADPAEADNLRADTAVRLAGAMLAEGREMRLFLAGHGIRLLAAARESTKATHELFQELLELGLTAQCCGTSLKSQGWTRSLPDGVSKNSLKGLSDWIGAADEVVCFHSIACAPPAHPLSRRSAIR
ncbi:MAG: DsrE family protein [Acidithiobacillus sp.]|uniref:DsrE family protein n=1 Tax=Acidithiobacillus sp. TaxID=1872118 RepID=UPI003D010300